MSCLPLCLFLYKSHILRTNMNCIPVIYEVFRGKEIQKQKLTLMILPPHILLVLVALLWYVIEGGGMFSLLTLGLKRV